MQNQELQIKNSLKTITQIFQDCDASYRVLGSIILVAQIDKVFRTIHDLDLLLDKKKKDCVFNKLKKLGFVLVTQNRLGFQYIEAKKKDHLTLTFMLLGDFNKDFFVWRFMNFFELRIKNSYLTPTTYEYKKIKFVGLPLSSAIAGIRMSFFNPKRRRDKLALGKIFHESNVKLYDNIIVYCGGVKLPFVYDIFSFLYNIYGGIRVRLGKKYEIWD